MKLCFLIVYHGALIDQKLSNCEIWGGLERGRDYLEIGRQVLSFATEDESLERVGCSAVPVRYTQYAVRIWRRVRVRNSPVCAMNGQLVTFELSWRQRWVRLNLGGF